MEVCFEGLRIVHILGPILARRVQSSYWAPILIYLMSSILINDVRVVAHVLNNRVLARVAHQLDDVNHLEIGPWIMVFHRRRLMETVRGHIG